MELLYMYIASVLISFGGQVMLALRMFKDLFDSFKLDKAGVARLTVCNAAGDYYFVTRGSQT